VKSKARRAVALFTLAQLGSHRKKVLRMAAQLMEKLPSVMLEET
jgi:hypothetical protein